MSVETYVVGDAGLALEYHFIDEDGDDIDISTETTLEVRIKSEGTGTVTNFAGVLVAGGTTGRMRYVLVGTEFSTDGAGTYEREGHVVTPTLTKTSETLAFEVTARIA